MTDTFFSQPNCDRCGCKLKRQARKMSWFTEDCLCEVCVDKESVLRNDLESKGVDVADLEGCGYMPNTKGGK